MSRLYLEDFMRTVAIESGPFDGIGLCIAPIKERGVTVVAYSELAT